MASPQLEDGYTPIANELMDALCQKSPGGANAQVFLAVIRKTYGWQKKQDSISIGQFMEMTGLSRRSVIYSLQNLEAMKMITIERGAGSVSNISVQKDYIQWLPEARGERYAMQLERQRANYLPVQRNEQILAPVQRIDTTSAKKTTLPVQGLVKNEQILAPTKERKQSTKETIQKKERSPLPELSILWIKKETWDAFLEMRKSMKATPTPHAIDLIFKELERFKNAGDDPNEILNQSIMNNWKGVFALKNGGQKDDTARIYRGNPSQKPAGAFADLG